MTYLVHNRELDSIIKDVYTPADTKLVWQTLKEWGALEFRATQQGLFPAAATADSENTGYKYVWVRDNVFVAYAHYRMGEYDIAAKTLSGLMAYFKEHQQRFTDIVETPELKETVMRRPHIRFNGKTLGEIDEDWEHAQNDALGYFVWLYCLLAAQTSTRALIALEQDEVDVLLRFITYFDAIRYWEDADSGHWEEGRKVSASSIGPVVAGLRELKSLILSQAIDAQTIDLSFPSGPEFSAGALSHQISQRIDALIRNGQTALSNILPWECRTASNKRRYDAALIYLVYPLKVVSSQQAENILADVKDALTGEYGIQRYPYDSFWCRDFQDLDKEIQTAKYTGREAWLENHNRAVERGEEAQWCIFDPIISAIYGERFQESGDSEDLKLQTMHLNRALGQITGPGNTVAAGAGNNEPVEIPAYRCPELYYIQHDEYVPNVSTPLLWTQANLCIALKAMEQSLAA